MPAPTSLPADEAFEAFRFYEEAAERTKGHAWTQTTWILTLNAGILAFSLNLYAGHRDDVPLNAFLMIEWISAGAGVLLCWYSLFVIGELGEHIRNYWTAANRIAAGYPPLVPYIGGESRAEEARVPGYRAPFPRFCERLKIPVRLFMAAHLGWAIIATGLTVHAWQV